MPAHTGSRHHFFPVPATLWAGAHAASHQRVLPNTWRTTFINVAGLLPAVHFFLWVPQVHFSCSSSGSAGYLVWPVPPQQYMDSISFKVLQSCVSADVNYGCRPLSIFTGLVFSYWKSDIVAEVLTVNVRRAAITLPVLPPSSGNTSSALRHHSSFHNKSLWTLSPTSGSEAAPWVQFKWHHYNKYASFFVFNTY